MEVVPESSQVTALGALLSKDVPALRRILKKTPGAVNERQWDNETTLLHIAIDQRDESMVLVLLDYPVNLAVEDKDNLTALNVAAIEGLSGIVKILLARLGTANTQEKASSLIGASSAGHLGTVEVLLGSGIGLEGTSRIGNGVTALLAAARMGHVAVVKLLLQYGANLQARAHNGMSALHRAVIGGKQDVVAVLVQEHTRMRIPVDIKENAGQSPLHVAARKGYKAIAETLIQNGAGIEERCQGGNTPLITASGHGQKGVVLVLLARGADVTAVDRQGMAPLAWAAKGGFFEVVEALLAKGAYIDRVDIYNQSALFYATTGGHGRVVELLLRVRAQRVQASIQQAQMMRAQAVSMAQAQRYGYGHPYGPQPSPHWPYR
jgi:ankyrin repeat protein